MRFCPVRSHMELSVDWHAELKVLPCFSECGNRQSTHLLSKCFISLYLHLDFIVHPRHLMDALLPTTLREKLVEFDKCSFCDESPCALKQGVECSV